MGEQIKIAGDSVVLSVNPSIYPLETVYSASYVFIDRAYVLLDGDPEKEIIVKLKPKIQEDLEKLGGEFMNELINYADYKTRAEDTKEIRNAILQRAILTNSAEPVINDEEFDKIMEEIGDDDSVEDPEGIAVPWEEKYGDIDEGCEDESNTK